MRPSPSTPVGPANPSGCGGLRRALAAASFLVMAAGLAGAAQAGDLCNNTNGAGVMNNPASHRTPCNITQTSHITQLITYHWNNGRGARPGTILLFNPSTGQQFGPFPAIGTSGQGGAPNVNWIANVNITVPAGAYQVIDSDPSTWSWNAASGGNGFARVEGDHTTPIVPIKPGPGPMPGPNPGPRPPIVGGGGGGGGGVQQLAPVRFTAPVKNACVHKQWLYTLHIRAGDGSNTVVVTNVSSAPAGVTSAGYDSASQTVEGYGLKAGAATVTVTGYVEAVNGNIPFVLTLPVTVKACD